MIWLSFKHSTLIFIENFRQMFHLNILVVSEEIFFNKHQRPPIYMHKNCLKLVISFYSFWKSSLCTFNFPLIILYV